MSTPTIKINTRMTMRITSPVSRRCPFGVRATAVVSTKGGTEPVSFMVSVVAGISVRLAGVGCVGTVVLAWVTWVLLVALAALVGSDVPAAVVVGTTVVFPVALDVGTAAAVVVVAGTTAAVVVSSVGKAVVKSVALGGEVAWDVCVLLLALVVSLVPAVVGVVAVVLAVVEVAVVLALVEVVAVVPAVVEVSVILAVVVATVVLDCAEPRAMQRQRYTIPVTLRAMVPRQRCCFGLLGFCGGGRGIYGHTQHNHRLAPHQ